MKLCMYVLSYISLTLVVLFVNTMQYTLYAVEQLHGTCQGMYIALSSTTVAILLCIAMYVVRTE